MSFMENLSPKEKEAFDELKGRIYDDVPDHLRDDKFLYLRFLRARNFNVTMAEGMLRNHLAWRKSNDMNNILTDFIPPEVTLRKASQLENLSSSEQEKSRMAVAAKYLPLKRFAFDKDGAPVRYLAFGNMDAKGILKSVKKNEVVKTVMRFFEGDLVVMKEQSEKLQKPIQQWTWIFDFENYNLAKATHKQTIETLITLFLTYEANYPERLKAAYVINASIYFTIIFSIIKPLLSGATVKKITIFGKEGWKETLLNDIAAEDLPAFLGGKRTDPDGNPLCHTIVNHGGDVPEEFYLSKNTNRLRKQPGVQKLTVARMSKAILNLDVVEPGSLIEWEFETPGKDIGFGLLYKSSEYDDKTKELVPNQRIDTQLVSEAGMFQCELPGIYILVFDNSYSWIHQKDIYYKATVVNPKDPKSDEE